MKRFMIAVCVVLSVCVASPALTITPTFDDTGAKAWTQTEKEVVNTAIAEWNASILNSETVDITFDFANGGTDYLGRWEGAWDGAVAGDNIRPWYKTSHVVHFNADLLSGDNYLWFDSTPDTDGDQPFAAWDALTVARHELGHALGFDSVLYVDNAGQPSEVNLWTEQITGTTFDPTGLNVSMESDLVHTVDSGQTLDTLMNAALPNGSRYEIGQLELDMLNTAYGYDVLPEPTTAVILFGGTVALLARRRRRRIA